MDHPPQAHRVGSALPAPWGALGARLRRAKAGGKRSSGKNAAPIWRFGYDHPSCIQARARPRVVSGGRTGPQPTPRRPTYIHLTLLRRARALRVHSDARSARKCLALFTSGIHRKVKFPIVHISICEHRAVPIVGPVKLIGQSFFLNGGKPIVSSVDIRTFSRKGPDGRSPGPLAHGQEKVHSRIKAYVPMFLGSSQRTQGHNC